MNKPLKITLLLLVLCVAFFIGRCSKQVIEKEVRKTDTLTIFKTDTITHIKPVFLKELSTDTLYRVISKTDTVFLPIVQRYYAEKGVYDLWVSGVDPILDSIKTYQRTETKTITNTVERTLIEKKWNFYVGAGAGLSNGMIFPVVEFDAYAPSRWGAGVSVGYFNNSIVCQGTIKIKL